MTGGNGQVTRAMREALERVIAENRELRRASSRGGGVHSGRPDSAPPLPDVRHCGYCGHPVCGCGLNGYVDPRRAER